MDDIVVLRRNELEELLETVVQRAVNKAIQKNPAKDQPGIKAEMLTMKDTAAMLGMSVNTLKSRIMEGEIDLKPAISGGRPKYARKDVEKIIQQLTNEG